MMRLVNNTRKIFFLILYKLFTTLKIRKNTVLLSDFYGERFTNDIEEILKYLLSKKYDKVLYVIVFNHEILNKLPGNVLVVKRFSFLHLFYAATAGVRINSCHESSLLKKRSGTLNIQVWHGTPLKKIGMQVQGAKFKKMRQATMEDAKTWDLLLAPTPDVAKIYSEAFAFDKEKIIVDQMPREIVMTKIQPHVPFLITNDKTFDFATIKDGKKLCLYTPTFRDDDKSDNKLRFCIRKFNELFSDQYVLGVRLHNNIVRDLPATYTQYLYDFSKFNDLPTLLRHTDVLITDYSSLIFDFYCLNKPIIKYAYDFKHYTDKLRSLNFDLEAVPGSIAYNEEQLFEQLLLCLQAKHNNGSALKNVSPHTGRFYPALESMLFHHDESFGNV